MARGKQPGLAIELARAQREAEGGICDATVSFFGKCFRLSRANSDYDGADSDSGIVAMLG